MDIRDMTAAERAAYVRGLDDGARRTRETIAASLVKSAAEWKRTSRIFGPTVATTLEGLAEALCATKSAPTPADALAQDAAESNAEDDIEQARRGA